MKAVIYTQSVPLAIMVRARSIVPFIGSESRVFTVRYKKTLMGQTSTNDMKMRSFISVYTHEKDAQEAAHSVEQHMIGNSRWPNGDVKDDDIEVDAHTLTCIEDDLLRRGLCINLFSKGKVLNGVRIPRTDMDFYVTLLADAWQLDNDQPSAYSN
jgi:hypothetical protein